VKVTFSYTLSISASKNVYKLNTVHGLYPFARNIHTARQSSLNLTWIKYNRLISPL